MPTLNQKYIYIIAYLNVVLYYKIIELYLSTIYYYCLMVKNEFCKGIEIAPQDFKIHFLVFSNIKIEEKIWIKVEIMIFSNKNVYFKNRF